MSDSDGRHNMDETYARVIAWAWSDPEYKARLLSEPKAVLAEAGMKIGDDVTVAAVESTPTQMYFVLPPAPAVELTEDDLPIAAASDAATKSDASTASQGAPRLPGVSLPTRGELSDRQQKRR